MIFRGVGTDLQPTLEHAWPSLHGSLRNVDSCQMHHREQAKVAACFSGQTDGVIVHIEILHVIRTGVDGHSGHNLPCKPGIKITHLYQAQSEMIHTAPGSE